MVARSGVFDMLRAEQGATGPFNVPDRGSVTKVNEFHALYAYSPYHHVRANAPYPAILLTSGDDDPRVDPWHAKKFAAALQAATASSRPALLSVRDRGHFAGDDETVDWLAFLMDQLAVNWPEAARKR